MNIFWTPILRPLLAAARARRVIEIGADSGRNSQRLARWCRANGAFADIIDPLPGFDAAEFDRKWEGAAKVHLAPSLDILDSLPAADVVLIDGTPAFADKAGGAGQAPPADARPPALTGPS